MITTDEVKKWRNRYKTLLDSINVGFVLADLEFRFLDVNKALLKMTGFPREKFIGAHTIDIYGKQEFERMKNLVLPYRNKIDDFQFEFFLPTAGGRKIPVLHNSHIERDEKGNPKTVYATITDIRAQKRLQRDLESTNEILLDSFDTLEKEKGKLERILFGIGDCVTIFDPDENLILSNPKGMEIRGKRRKPLWSPESREEKRITLKVGDEMRHFQGRIQGIQDQKDIVYAYVEIIRDITSQVRLEQKEDELTRIKREMSKDQVKTEIIGISRAMQKVFELIVRCSEIDSTIIILGETGVGKEVAARAIHSQSHRKNNPFVAINCGALPETLLESELFGHVKGAFTGATSEHRGLFREAHGGTLFLDEVGDLNSALQVKLLRALQEKEIRPVGGSRTYSIDARVITATNRKLDKLVEGGTFRNDLYYRLAVIPLSIPPLRVRKADIIPLANHFIKKYKTTSKWPNLILDHQAQERLLSYSWPGNVRELENAIEHCVAMTQKPILTPDSLPVQISEVIAPGGNYNHSMKVDQDINNKWSNQKPLHDNLPEQIFQTEKKAILDALNSYKWNRSLAARSLGIGRSTLWRKMKKYGLT